MQRKGESQRNWSEADRNKPDPTLGALLKKRALAVRYLERFGVRFGLRSLVTWSALLTAR
jgi:hypothetical protein